MPGCITSESGETWHTWPLRCYGRGWLPDSPSSSHRAKKAAQRKLRPTQMSAWTSSLIEELVINLQRSKTPDTVPFIASRVDTFPMSTFSGGGATGPQRLSWLRVPKERISHKSTKSVTGTITGAYYFWRYAKKKRPLTTTLRARKERRSEAKVKRYRVHSPLRLHRPETQFRRLPQ